MNASKLVGVFFSRSAAMLAMPGPVSAASAGAAAADLAPCDHRPSNPGGSSRRFRATIAVLAISVAALFATASSASATSVGTITNVSYGSAHITGKVTASGFTSWNFEYSTNETTWSAGPSEFIYVPGGSGEVPIKGDLSGLKGSTRYFIRLAVNGAPTASPYPEFTTLAVEPPTVLATNNPSPIFSTAATATGKVKRPANADPAFDVKCRFEYVTDAQFSGSGFQNAAQAPCEQNPITATKVDSGGELEVSAELGGLNPALAPSTTYHLRLAAENAGGTVTKDAASTFNTAPPVTKPTVIAANNATEINKRTAQVSGEVERPAGADRALNVSCRFEYITEAQFTGNPPGEEFAGASQTPCTEGLSGSPPNFPAVSAAVKAELNGLAPNTTYHLRLAAENGGGTNTKVAAETFKTVAVIPASVTVDSITGVGYQKAFITATADPGNQGFNAEIEYALAGTNEWFGALNGGGIGGAGPGSPPQQISKPLGPSGCRYLAPVGPTSLCTTEHLEGLYYEQPGPGLKPGTTYKARGAWFDYDEGLLHSSPQPYPEFTTKGTSTPAAVTFDQVSSINITGAHFSGLVNTQVPSGPLNEEAKAAYETAWHFECSPECPGLSGTVKAEEGSKAISVDATRLEGNTFYEAKLIAHNSLGTVETPTQTFSTPFVTPEVKATPGGSAGKGSYNIGGLVTPFNTKITNCHFEYGPTTQYVYSAPCSPDPVGRSEVQSITVGANFEQEPTTFKLAFHGQTTESMAVEGPASLVEQELKALSAIGPDGVFGVERSIGFFSVTYTIHFSGPLSSTNVLPLRALSGAETVNSPGGNFAGSLIQGGNNAPVLVEAHLTGLTPGATYHYRVVATNSKGTVNSDNSTFVSPLAADESACPNEQRRIENNSTRLPECRAYELVSSAPKNGFPAEQFHLGRAFYSEDEVVGYTSVAGNIENSGQGSAFGNYYIAHRTDAGWQTAANLNGPLGSIYAPRGKIDGINFNKYSPDLLQSIWFLSVEGKPEAPYLRDSDGKFTQITLPPPKPGFFGVQGLYQGASQDLSHSFWIGENYLGEGYEGGGSWAPGVGLGIYEFEGTGNTGIPRQVDVKNNGEPISQCTFGGSGNAGSSVPAASSFDGKTVVVTIKGCEGHAEELWARVNASKSYFVSESQCTRTPSDPGGACYTPALAYGPYGESGPADAIFEGATPDGSNVFFTTSQQLVNGDTNHSNDLYRYELPSTSNPNPSPDLIDVTSSGPNAQVQRVLCTSEDGSTVYFVAQGVLASDHDALGEAARDGDYNLYAWHQDASHPEGQTAFIGRLTSSADIASLRSEVTPDGRYFVFSAYSTLTPTDTDEASDVYRYDDVSGELIRVSVGATGTGGNGDGLNAEIPINVGSSHPIEGAAARYEHPAVTNDGAEIVFTTSEALTADDGNGASDAYIWKDGRTSLISTGSVGGGASAADIDGSGRNVYFSSSQQLTQEDTDSVADVYDAHINGGFSFARVESCVGEACQPPQSGVHPVPSSGSDHSSGPGNYRRATTSLMALTPSERAKLAAGDQVGLRVRVSGGGKITIKGTTVIQKRQKEAFTGTGRAVQAGMAKVPVALEKSALARLRRAGSLKLQIAIEFADAKPSTTSLTLKSHRAKTARTKRRDG